MPTHDGGIEIVCNQETFVEEEKKYINEKVDKKKTIKKQKKVEKIVKNEKEKFIKKSSKKQKKMEVDVREKCPEYNLLLHGLESDWIEEEMASDDDFMYIESLVLGGLNANKET